MATSGNHAGEINPSCLYTLDEAKARTGWGKWAFRSARRRGLVVRKVGVRHYVSGKDLITFIEQVGEVVGGSPS